jgi:hypothetical protein
VAAALQKRRGPIPKGLDRRHKAANIAFLRNLGRTFEKYHQSILTYDDYEISSEYPEDANNNKNPPATENLWFRRYGPFELNIYTPTNLGGVVVE